MGNNAPISERKYVIPHNVLAMWENTVCEMRREIKAGVSDKKSKWLLTTCDKLEQSMCAIAGGKYNLYYTLYAE